MISISVKQYPLAKPFLLAFFLLLINPLSAQTFYRSYGNSSVGEGGVCLIASPDGNLFVGGYKNDSAMVMKMDLAGNILWIRTMKPVSGGDNHVLELETTPDGFLIGLGNKLTGGLLRDEFHFKFDMNGNLQWLTRVNDTRAIIGASIHAKSASEYLLVADVHDMSSPTWADVIIYRIDASTGNVISNTSRYNYIGSNPYIDEPYASVMNTTNTRLYTTGRTYVNGSQPDGMRPFLSKFDINGNHLSTAYLGWSSAQSARIYSTDIIYRSDSLTMCYWGDINSGGTDFTVGLMRTDTAGNLAWSKNYDITSSSMEYASKVLATPTGYFIIGYATGSVSNFFIISTSMTGNFLWAKMYGGNSSTEFSFSTTAPTSQVINNQVYFTGQTGTGSGADLVLASTDLNGNSNCASVTAFSVSQTNNPLNRTTITPGTVAATLSFLTGGAATFQPVPDACQNLQLNLGNNTSTCTSITLNATLPGATSYLWSTGATTSSISVSTPATYWATVYVGCCVYSDTIVISGGSSVAQFSFTGSACGSPVTFTNTSTNTSSYYWDFGDLSNSTQTNPVHTYNAPGTYQVSLIASGSCGADTMYALITVTAGSVNAGFMSVTNACSASPIFFSNTSSGATSYSWNFGDAGTSNASSPTHAYASPGTYTVTLIASGNCDVDTVIQTVTISAAPVAAISGTDTICNGQMVVLTASGSSGFQWSGGSTATTASITVSPSSTTTYYVVTNNGVCVSAPDTHTVYVIQQPIATISGIDSICSGQSVTLVANGGQAYQWSGGSNATTSFITVSPTTTTVYYVTPISQCVGTPDTHTVIVIPVPIVNTTGDVTICSGQSTTITATGGSSYQWSGGNTDTTASITVSPVATTTYFVTVSNGTCTSGFDTVTVTVTPAPTVNIVAPTMICPGTGVTLTAVGNATTWVWAGGASGTGTTITDNPTSPTTYYLVGYNSLGCSDTDAVTVGLYDVMNAAILGDDSICVGESTALSCAGSGTYAWAPPTGLNTTSGPNVIATPTVTTTYSLTFTDANGCVTTDAVTIQVDQCVGIEEAENNDMIVLQPNPASQSTTVFLSNHGEAMITIFDALGQVVIQQQTFAQAGNGIVLDLAGLSEGLYTIQVMSSSGTANKPLLISR